jgi:hypothetical protein
MYPHLLLAFGYYVEHYQGSAWHTPYKVHETYDAVPETAKITGEGNRGSSLYNAVNYLCGLHCMLGFARYKHDDAIVQQVESMIKIVRESIQQHFWQPEVGFYVGDTNDGNKYDGLLEPNGYSWKSADGLHGQVLAYRLGFGDLLPRIQMKLHQQYMYNDLITKWGLPFDLYSQQNWVSVHLLITRLSYINAPLDNAPILYQCIDLTSRFCSRSFALLHT